MFVKAILILLSIELIFAEEDGSAYYSDFSGPVSGSAEEISVPRGNYAAANEPMTFDYVAKPDYAYAYGFHDPDTGNSQKREETRNGNVVKGEYSLIEPDGSLRRVLYTADPKHGFRATVIRIPPKKVVSKPNMESSPFFYFDDEDSTEY